MIFAPIGPIELEIGKSPWRYKVEQKFESLLKSTLYEPKLVVIWLIEPDLGIIPLAGKNGTKKCKAIVHYMKDG